MACYQPMIYPTNGENLWESTPYPDILPPPVRKMPGRPKRSRNKAADEKKKDPSLVSKRKVQNKCSICKQPGHKKGSCKVVPPTQQQSSTQPPAPTQAPIPTQPPTPTKAPTPTQPPTTQAPTLNQSQPSQKQPSCQPASKKRKKSETTKKSKTAHAQTTKAAASQPIPNENGKRLKRLRKVGTSTQPTGSATSSLFKEGATSTMSTRSKLQTRKATS